MTPTPFAFPPPPPPPQVQSSQNMQSFSQAPPSHKGYVGRGAGRGRCVRGQGRPGNARDFSKEEFLQNASTHSRFRPSLSAICPDFNGTQDSRDEGEQSAANSSFVGRYQQSVNGNSTGDLYPACTIDRPNIGHIQGRSCHAESNAGHYAPNKSFYQQPHESIPQAFKPYSIPKPSYPQHDLQGSLAKPENLANSKFHFRGRGGKRKLNNAFGRDNAPQAKTQVAPAVPAFGVPLPVPPSPSAPQATAKPPKKKQRSYNLLGLTPKADVYQSSEGEDDADEESKLAAADGIQKSHPQLLQITHKGQTFKLQSATDIAHWIDERRKRYPTRERIAEAQLRKGNQEKARRGEGAHLVEKKIQNQTQKKQKAGETPSRHKFEANKPQNPLCDGSAENAVAKARVNLDKLRKQLAKEEKRVAEAESQARFTHDTLKSQPTSSVQADFNTGNNIEGVAVYSLQSTVEPLEPNSQAGSYNTAASREHNTIRSAVSLSDSTSDVSMIDTDDSTSSSGTSSLDVQSDSGSPEQLPMKRNQVQRIPPPKRHKPRQICRTFQRKGNCKFGAKYPKIKLKESRKFGEGESVSSKGWFNKKKSRRLERVPASETQNSEKRALGAPVDRITGDIQESYVEGAG